MTWPTFISIAQKVSKSLLLVKNRRRPEKFQFSKLFSPFSLSSHGRIQTNFLKGISQWNVGSTIERNSIL